MRQLHVWLNDHLVGLLSEDNNLWRFSYDESWLSAPEEYMGFSIAPGLPVSEKIIVDGSSVRPVQWFFDNLLPEEDMRLLMAKDAKIDKADAFGLLTYYGEESAGSLTLLPPGQVVTCEGLAPLDDEELHERIAQLPNVPMTHRAPKKMSLAGAQHKLPVNLLPDGTLQEPVGHTPSTHILKPEHPQTHFFHQTVMNEYFCMELARRVGLNVPPVFVRYVPEPVYLIERFDRYEKNGQPHRRHTIDACQVTQLSGTYKYTASDTERYNQLIAATRSKALTRKNLFEWVLFNYLIGNSDAHLKNLSFFITATEIKLAPFYDLLSTVIYRQDVAWPQAELSTPFGEAHTYDAVTLEELLVFAEQLKIQKKLALRWKDKLLEKALGEAEHLLTLLDNQAWPEQAQLYRAGELRLVRDIVYRVIRENSARIDAA